MTRVPFFFRCLLGLLLPAGAAAAAAGGPFNRNALEKGVHRRPGADGAAPWSVPSQRPRGDPLAAPGRRG